MNDVRTTGTPFETSECADPRTARMVGQPDTYVMGVVQNNAFKQLQAKPTVTRSLRIQMADVDGKGHDDELPSSSDTG